VDENDIAVEWLILADAAEVVGNKLYLLGGGWDVLTVNSGFPVVHAFAVAVSFRVPWSETNRPFAVEVEMQDADGNVLATVAGKTEVGRPPGIPVGHPQRTQIAANMALPLAKPGTYVIIARIEGAKEDRVPFNVVPGPVLLMQQQEKDPGAA
jgi:hypothetical protein